MLAINEKPRERKNPGKHRNVFEPRDNVCRNLRFVTIFTKL